MDSASEAVRDCDANAWWGELVSVYMESYARARERVTSHLNGEGGE